MQVVDASGSRAQLIALEPLVLKVVTFTFSYASLAKESKMTQNAGLTAEFAAVFCPLECQAQNLA